MNVIRATVVCLCLAEAVPFVSAQDAAAPARPQVPPEQRFKQWDKNGDGKLTPDEVPGERLFKMLDKNGDGVVTPEEAVAAFGSGAGQRQPWRGVGVSESAPLPPAENFKPRAHGDEAKAAGLKPGVLAKLDVEMERHVAARNVAGVVALIHKNGAQGYFETLGMQSIEANKPMPKDAIFRLMSMTKPIIAVTALTLYDEGKFTLDEPISKHLPEWAEPKVLEDGKLVPAKFAITPRMLMSHSSGLYYGNLDGAGKNNAVPAMAYEAMRGGRASLKDFSEALAKEPLKFQPGTAWQYGTSIDVLGRYLEAATGQPLDVVICEKLTGPLKMADTDFWVQPERAARLCQIYKQPRPGVLEPGNDLGRVTVKPALMMGGNGMFSTATDYERFCRMLLNRGELDGVRLLKPETVDMIFLNHLRFPGPQKYGLGGLVDGDGVYGWGGADGTQFWIDRKNKFFAIFMVQTQMYKAPTYPVFRTQANEAAGITASRTERPN
jgi:CubicO group peptidase (beta-lactamase class C family)